MTVDPRNVAISKRNLVNVLCSLPVIYFIQVKVSTLASSARKVANDGLLGLCCKCAPFNSTCLGVHGNSPVVKIFTHLSHLEGNCFVSSSLTGVTQ